MKKDEFLKNFKEEDRNEAMSVYNKLTLALNKDIPVFSTEFYTPNIWKVLEEKIKIKDFKIESFGIFNDAERRIISFNNIYSIEYPIKILRIKNKSKFKNLTHKDYLGSLMNLGIKRSKMGDLIVENDFCYVCVLEDIANYIEMNLAKVSSSSCEVDILEEGLDINHNFTEETINIQSMRLDSIVSKITKKSRSVAEDLISNGSVLINYSISRDKSKEIKTDDRITIRKYGKYILGDKSGNTKSGKLKITIKKYT
ncbi:MAG: RNA-binding protein [Clostridium sp.]|uniref:YlmH family RNA-binding protein n=1 Tax=Clostridium sp. TaxID=1506 RepID=UPI003F4038A5